METGGQGFYVSSITIEDIRRMFEVRELIEPYMAREAAEKVEEDPILQNTVREIRESIERIEKIAEETELSDSMFTQYRDINYRIYELFLQALGKSPWKHVFELLGDHINRVCIFTENLSHLRETNVVRDNDEEHMEIIQAIEEGDSSRSEEATREHLSSAEKRSTEITRIYKKELEGAKN